MLPGRREKSFFVKEERKNGRTKKDGRIYFVISVIGFNKPNARMYDDEIVQAETFI